YIDLPSVRTDTIPCPALTQTTRTELPTRKRRCADIFYRSLLPACLRCLPAKSDAVIAPCAADGEPLPLPLPQVPLWLLSRRQCGCGARNAALFTRQQASEKKKMKCFSRYLPYLFRPPSTILSSTCHTEEPDKEAPYRAGPLGLCSGWQAAAQTETAIGMGELRTRSPILVAPPSISCKSDMQQLGRRRAVTGLLPSGVRDGM
ncbi:hypothetical protein F7725_009872, partial [Dissostichus mawsoni]